MKKSLAISLIIVLSISMLGGCFGSGGAQELTLTEYSGETSTTQGTDNSEIAGKYTMVAWFDADGDYLKYLVSEGVNGEDLFIELEEDGTYVWDMSAANEWVDRGTYTVIDGNDLLFTYSGGEDWLRIDGVRIFFFVGDDRLSFKKVETAESPEPDIDPDRVYNDTDEIKEFERKLAEIAGPPKGAGAEELLQLFRITNNILGLHEDVAKNSESWAVQSDSFGLSPYVAVYVKEITLFGKPTDARINIEDEKWQFVDGTRLEHETIYDVSYTDKNVSPADVVAMVIDVADLLDKEPFTTASIPASNSEKIGFNEREINDAIVRMKDVGEFDSSYMHFIFSNIDIDGGWSGFSVQLGYSPERDGFQVMYNIKMTSLKG